MQINPYLDFNGNCETAFRFHAQALNGTIEMMLPYEGTPAEVAVPAESRKLIVHARLKVGNTLVMGCDAPGEHYKTPQGFSVSLEVSTPEEAERAFQALSTGGKVRMPMEQTFFCHSIRHAPRSVSVSRGWSTARPQPKRKPRRTHHEHFHTQPVPASDRSLY